MTNTGPVRSSDDCKVQQGVFVCTLVPACSEEGVLRCTAQDLTQAVLPRGLSTCTRLSPAMGVAPLVHCHDCTCTTHGRFLTFCSVQGSRSVDDSVVGAKAYFKTLEAILLYK